MSDLGSIQKRQEDLLYHTQLAHGVVDRHRLPSAEIQTLKEVYDIALALQTVLREHQELAALGHPSLDDEDALWLLNICRRVFPSMSRYFRNCRRHIEAAVQTAEQELKDPDQEGFKDVIEKRRTSAERELSDMMEISAQVPQLRRNFERLVHEQGFLHSIEDDRVHPSGDDYDDSTDVFDERES